MGYINVFSGPMKSGKSSTLIKEARNQVENGKNVKFFKPLMDDRFSKDNIVDRDGNIFPAINIEKIDEIENYDADIYLIDEFQFLQGEITAIQKLASKGKKFYIAGLNLTTEMKPFGKMGELLCNSDNVKMMTAHCECCNKNEAIYTFCTAEKTGDILIGDEMYIPVCAECYTKLMNDKNNK